MSSSEDKCQVRRINVKFPKINTKIEKNGKFSRSDKLNQKLSLGGYIRVSKVRGEGGERY